MKKIILSIFLIFFAMLFAQENILFKSDVKAELNGYDYANQILDTLQKILLKF